MSLYAEPKVSLKTILALMLTLIMASPLLAQWARVFGSPGDESLFSVCQSSAGDYIAVGYHYEPYADSPLVMKITYDGRIKWKNYYGFFSFARPQIVLPTVGEGCIVAGYKEVHGEDYGADIWIIKLDKQGKALWEKSSGKPHNERCFSMSETSDGSYLLAGELESQALIMKLSSEGDVIWQKSYAISNSRSSRLNSIQQTLDGGIVATGVVHFPSNSDLWVCKLGERGGGIIWAYTFNGSRWDEGFSVVETHEGNFAVCGKVDNENCILCLNSTGGVIWQNKYVGNMQDKFNSIYPTTDGGLIAVGENYSCPKPPYSGTYHPDVFLVRLSFQGDILWQKIYGGDFSLDKGFCVQQTLDGSYILVGETCSWGAGESDALILKLWRNGNISPISSYAKKACIAGTEISLLRSNIKIRISRRAINLIQRNTLKEKAKGRIYALGENSVHKLIIKAGQWGTTDPPPGIYHFANGTDVRIKAIPESDYDFVRWEGHIDTTAEHLAFNLDGDKTIKAIFGEPSEWSGSGGGGIGNVRIAESRESLLIVMAGIGLMVFLFALACFLSHVKYIRRKRIFLYAGFLNKTDILRDGFEAEV